MTLQPAVQKAIEELRTTFESCEVLVTPDGAGGAHVEIRNLPLGPPYNQENSWFGFHLTYQYPYADVYPHFVRSDLTRRDGARHGSGIAGGSFQGRQATQLSRRSNHWKPGRDTAALKLLKVHQWLMSH
jgi:hypothetical protein